MAVLQNCWQSAENPWEPWQSLFQTFKRVHLYTYLQRPTSAGESYCILVYTLLYTVSSFYVSSFQYIVRLWESKAIRGLSPGESSLIAFDSRDHNRKLILRHFAWIGAPRLVSVFSQEWKASVLSVQHRQWNAKLSTSEDLQLRSFSAVAGLLWSARPTADCSAQEGSARNARRVATRAVRLQDDIFHFKFCYWKYVKTRKSCEALVAACDEVLLWFQIIYSLFQTILNWYIISCL